MSDPKLTIYTSRDVLNELAATLDRTSIAHLTTDDGAVVEFKIQRTRVPGCVISPAPLTFGGTKPEDILGRMVHLRPYYQVPTGRGSRGLARSPWVVPAWVEEASNDREMVTVKIHHDYDGPWRMQGSYYPKELHQSACVCPACRGNGIFRLKGA